MWSFRSKGIERLQRVGSNQGSANDLNRLALAVGGSGRAQDRRNIGGALGAGVQPLAAQKRLETESQRLPAFSANILHERPVTMQAATRSNKDGTRKSRLIEKVT